MSDPIKVGIIRCDTHGMYYAALMSGHDPLKLQVPVPVEDDPPYSWQNGAVHYYFYGFCADPRQMTVETVGGFRIVNVWDVHRDAAENISAVLDDRPRVCDTFDQVSEGVDLVFIADCNEDGSDHLALATPGLERGVVTFVDKPLANEVTDARRILDLGRQHGAPVFSASILRHLPAAKQFRVRLPDVGPVDCATIRGLSGHIAGQIHSVSLAQAVFGNGIAHVRAMGPGEMGVTHLSWGDREDRPRSGVVIQNGGAHYHCSMHMTAYGPQGAILAENNINDWTFPSGAARILDLVREMVRTGEVDDSLDDMVEAVAAVNAGRRSLAEGSRAVSLDEIA
ncbi:MAG: hypothetical protein CMJ18_04130 [Phycisphaeraceae bacterium]|nr:hypothetical protein [Phycisphaeraceae bacterium]